MEKTSRSRLLSDRDARLLMPSLSIYEDVIWPEFTKRNLSPLSEFTTLKVLDVLVSKIVGYIKEHDIWIHPKLLYEGLVLCNAASTHAVQELQLADTMSMTLVFAAIGSFLLVMRDEFVARLGTVMRLSRTGL